MYRAGDFYYKEFTVSDPITGEAANADSLPTAVLVKNGVDEGSLTVANKEIGVYDVTGTIPLTYGVGDKLEIRVTAVVGGKTAKQVIDTVTVVAEFPGATDISGLATKTDVYDTMARVMDGVSLAQQASEAVTGRTLLDPCDSLTGWSGDDSMSFNLVSTSPLHGGYSVKVSIDIATAYGDEATRLLPDYWDLSLKDDLKLLIKTNGAGDFLRFSLSEDGVSWTDWDLIIVDENVNRSVEYVMDLTTMPIRTNVNYYKFKILNTNIDVSRLEGLQLWSSEGITTLEITVDRIEGVVDVPLAVAGLPQDLVDISALALYSQVEDMRLAIKDPIVLSEIILEYASSEKLIDRFEEVWVSSDINYVDLSRDLSDRRFGAFSQKALINVTGSYGTYWTKTLPDGHELDLSLFSNIYVWIKSMAAGDWLNFKMSEDGAAWEDTGTLTLPEANIGIWAKYTIDISSIVSANKDSIKYFRWEITSENFDSSSVPGLQLFSAQSIFEFKMDWLVGMRSFAGVPAGDWA